MHVDKREHLIHDINQHLRTTARQLVLFDSEEEALQCIIDLFQSKFTCDFISILLKEGTYLRPKITIGSSDLFKEHFPIHINSCYPDLLKGSFMKGWMPETSYCQLDVLLKEENIPSWFTVLVKEKGEVYGICVIGFKENVPLYEEMSNTFDDFGKDMAVAIQVARQKENQKQKMAGIEWSNQSLSVNSSIEMVVKHIVERAGEGTHAALACVYFFNEAEKSFIYQPPSYGELIDQEKIFVHDKYHLKDHFPFLAVAGGNELTVSLTVNLKMIGVIQVKKKQGDSSVFSEEDVALLEELANHAATMIDNVRLYQNEKKNQQKLHSLLDYQQSLVKETVEKESFEGITKTVSLLFSKSVILFDRFMRPIAYHLYEQNEEYLELMTEQSTYFVFQRKQGFENSMNHYLPLLVWPINNSGNLVGYLAIDIDDNEMDEFLRLSIDMAINIFSIQFIKQKLVFQAKEQVKDSYINRLLVKQLDNKEEIIQYANIFHWNLFSPHRVAVLKIKQKGNNDRNVFSLRDNEISIVKQIKNRLSSFDKDLIYATRGEELIIIVPVQNEGEQVKKYWNNFYSYIENVFADRKQSISLLVGIGGKTEKIEDYYLVYQQAKQAITVISNIPHQTGLALYDELGAYTLLYSLKDRSEAFLFLVKHLGGIMEQESKGTDLLQTLRAYLYHNGSIKDTSNELFVHRSTLQYRIEKIQGLLNINLMDAETRFNLMLAFKLYDLMEDNSLIVPKK